MINICEDIHVPYKSFLGRYLRTQIISSSHCPEESAMMEVGRLNYHPSNMFD
jgi:hypothetical protein